MEFKYLSTEHKEELKQRILFDKMNEKNETPSYEEMANANEIISDEELEENYGGCEFSEDDFWYKENLKNHEYLRKAIGEEKYAKIRKEFNGFLEDWERQLRWYDTATDEQIGEYGEYLSRFLSSVYSDEETFEEYLNDLREDDKIMKTKTNLIIGRDYPISVKALYDNGLRTLENSLRIKRTIDLNSDNDYYDLVSYYTEKVVCMDGECCTVIAKTVDGDYFFRNYNGNHCETETPEFRLTQDEVDIAVFVEEEKKTETDTSENYKKQVEEVSKLSITQLVEIRNLINKLCALVPADNEIYSEMETIIEPLYAVTRKCKTNHKCPVCGGRLYLSDLPQYDFVCPQCSENYYDCEIKE